MISYFPLEEFENQKYSRSKLFQYGYQDGFLVLAFPLPELLNSYVSTCEASLSWKSARVMPLHRGGDPRNLNNYRPISFINCIVKT